MPGVGFNWRRTGQRRRGAATPVADLTDVATTDTVRSSATGMIVARSGALASAALASGTSVTLDLYDGCNTTSSNNRSLGQIILSTGSPLYTPAGGVAFISGLRVVQTGAGSIDWSVA